MGKKNHDEFGHEIPDPTPMAIPVGYDRPETLAEMVQRMTRVEVSRVAQEVGHESFEEADDFEVGDSEVVLSAHELTPMQEEYVYERGISDTPLGDSEKGKVAAGDASAPAVGEAGAGLRAGRRAGDAPVEAQSYKGPERRGASMKGREAGQ